MMIDSARPQPKPHRSLLAKQRLHPLANNSSSPRNRRTSRAEDAEASPAIGVADQLRLELAENILARIESRLTGRVRNLTVFTTDNVVLLTGECSTFYTKQLAQHIAMGALEYEQLVNNIDVRVVK